MEPPSESGPDRAYPPERFAQRRTRREIYSHNRVTRTEHDALGAVEVPRDALWGAHTQRAIANFDVGGLTLMELPPLIAAFARVKAAAASTNADLGFLERPIATAIDAVTTEIASGSYRSAFPLPVLQGGGGTSTNMNVNEVIANLAEESLGGVRGAYAIVRPLDHVNRSQSTNDVYPTALALATLEVGDRALERFAILEAALRRAAEARPISSGSGAHAFRMPSPSQLVRDSPRVP